MKCVLIQMNMWYTYKVSMLTQINAINIQYYKKLQKRHSQSVLCRLAYWLFANICIFKTNEKLWVGSKYHQPITGEWLGVKQPISRHKCEHAISIDCNYSYFAHQYWTVCQVYWAVKELWKCQLPQLPFNISNCNWDFRPSIGHANHKVQHEQCIGLMQSHHLWTIH